MYNEIDLFNILFRRDSKLGTLLLRAFHTLYNPRVRYMKLEQFVPNQIVGVFKEYVNRLINIYPLNSRIRSRLVFFGPKNTLVLLGSYHFRVRNAFWHASDLDRCNEVRL